jgi:hypothetical protein
MAYNNLSGTVLQPNHFLPRQDHNGDIIVPIVSGNLSTSDGANIINVPRVYNATNNSLLTNVNGDANTITCETNLTFDGDTLNVVGDISASIGISASVYYGDGSNLTNIRADNVAAEGPAHSIQYHDYVDGDFTGSANLLFSSSNLYLTGNLEMFGTGTVEGDLIPAQADIYNLGSPSNPWGSLYISSSTIHFGTDRLSVRDGHLQYGSGTLEQGMQIGHMHLVNKGIHMDNGFQLDLNAACIKIHGGVVYNRSLVSGNYSLSAQDYYLGVDTSQNPVSLTLPSASLLETGQTFVVKDEGGSANTNNITIQVSDSDLIDGQNSVILESPFASIQLYCNGTDKFFIC